MSSFLRMSSWWGVVGLVLALANMSVGQHQSPYGEWGQWSSCRSVGCTRTRGRSPRCLQLQNCPSEQAAKVQIEKEMCYDTPSCASLRTWSPWSEQCRNICGSFLRIRTQLCTAFNGSVKHPCPGEYPEFMPCLPIEESTAPTAGFRDDTARIFFYTDQNSSAVQFNSYAGIPIAVTCCVVSRIPNLVLNFRFQNDSNVAKDVVTSSRLQVYQNSSNPNLLTMVISPSDTIDSGTYSCLALDSSTGAINPAVSIFQRRLQVDERPTTPPTTGSTSSSTTTLKQVTTNLGSFVTSTESHAVSHWHRQTNLLVIVLILAWLAIELV